MAKYDITFARSARKELERLDAQLVRRIFTHIESLAAYPRPPGCCKLQGSDNLWRIRVGDYRVVYSIDDRAAAIDISIVGHRKDVYRN